MKRAENPFDALASGILKNLDNSNIEKTLRQNPSELNLEELLEDNFWQTSSSRHQPSAKSPMSRDLENELNGLMKIYERASDQIHLKDLQKQVLRWEQKVQRTKISREERDALLAQGALARHFSQLWS